MAIIVGSILGGTLWHISGTTYLKGMLSTFSSHQELVDFLKMRPEDVPQSLFQRFLSAFQQLTNNGQTGFFPPGLERDLSAAESGGTPEYSTTNIQVEGVDEADIVKNDEEFLYLVSGSTVYILAAYPPETATILSKIETKDAIVGIFVNEDKLVVFQNYYGPDIYGPEIAFRTYLPYYGSAKTTITIYDISDRSTPMVEREVTVDGHYMTSRMMGDYVYVVANNPVYLVNDTVNLPEIRSGNSTMLVDPTNIYHTELPDYYHYFTNIIVIDLTDAEQVPKSESYLLGATSCVYVSRENIYLVSYGTNIHRISVKDGDITHTASGSVAGYVLNQFSMDEYNGYFRIATTTGNWGATTFNHLYILDSNLNIVGKVEDLAQGERIYSARFMGDKGFIVTFRQIDPLFVIDLSNPTNPQVLGYLKIPGVSDYLHPYDENHLIGIGRDATDEGRITGMKLSLFDITDVSNPTEISKYIIGEQGTYSEALYDHKAFLFSKSKQLLVIPIQLSEDGKWNVWQGAYVFTVMEESISFTGRITHLENRMDVSEDSSRYVKRALFIDDVLYTISDKTVKMNSLVDLKEIGSVTLS